MIIIIISINCFCYSPLQRIAHHTFARACTHTHAHTHALWHTQHTHTHMRARAPAVNSVYNDLPVVWRTLAYLHTEAQAIIIIISSSNSNNTHTLTRTHTHTHKHTHIHDLESLNAGSCFLSFLEWFPFNLMYRNRAGRSYCTWVARNRPSATITKTSGWLGYHYRRIFPYLWHSLFLC